MDHVGNVWKGDCVEFDTKEAMCGDVEAGEVEVIEISAPGSEAGEAHER